MTHCSDIEGIGEDSEKKYNPELSALHTVPGYIKRSIEWKEKVCLLNSIHKGKGKVHPRTGHEGPEGE